MPVRAAFVRSARAPNSVFELAFTAGSSLKRCLKINPGETVLSNDPEEPNANMVRSVWRRLKKEIKKAIIRDLQPKEDIKGGSDAKGESKPTTGDTGTRRGH